VPLLPSRGDEPVLAVVRPAPQHTRPEAPPDGRADLAAISDLLTEDVESDPAQHVYEFEDLRVSRGIQIHQFYWKAHGTWCPRAWRLGFVVRSAGGEIGADVEITGFDPCRPLFGLPAR
jgi:hypothetical protein